MRKNIIVILSFLLLSWLTACGGGNTPAVNLDSNVDGIDYNSYAGSKSFFSYTDSAYIFFNNGQLTFLEPTLSSPIAPLCAKPGCDHKTEDCTSRLNASGIYAYEDKLYYILWNTAGNTLELYSSDMYGAGRKKVSTLNISTGSNFSYEHNIGNGFAVVNLCNWKVDSQTQTLYLVHLASADETPTILFDVAYTEAEMHDGIAPTGVDRIWTWDNGVLFNVFNGDNYTLYGYNDESKEVSPLVENWAWNGNLAIQEDTLYWYIPGQSLYATQLSTGEDSMFTGDLPQSLDTIYYTFFDDQYIYLVSPDGSDQTEVYDYTGKLMQKMPFDAENRTLMFALPTPDYVFFYDFDADTCEPVCYLEKSAIANGTAEYIPLEHE